jgi:sugar lactone lactonase YvrE
MQFASRRTLGFLLGAAAAALAVFLIRGAGRTVPPAEPAATPTPVAAPVPSATTDSAPRTLQMRIFATIGDSASRIEGVAEHGGKLYVADWKDGGVYSVDGVTGQVTQVGQLPTKPGESLLGVAADPAGNIYVGAPQTGLIYRIDAAKLGKPDFKPRKDVSAFASGAGGANGLTFDRNGHLWVSGGDANAVYHVGPNGGKAVVFAKGYAIASNDTTIPVRGYVTNGLGIDSAGNVYTVNTGTGEITRLEVRPGYKLGRISTVAKDARLIGADGIILNPGGDMWVTANFSNTLAHVTAAGEVHIVVHDSTASVLHFPAEFKRIGGTFYVANLNFPMGANRKTSYKGAQLASIELP